MIGIFFVIDIGLWWYLKMKNTSHWQNDHWKKKTARDARILMSASFLLREIVLLNFLLVLSKTLFWILTKANRKKRYFNIFFFSSISVKSFPLATLNNLKALCEIQPNRKCLEIFSKGCNQWSRSKRCS